MGRDPECDVIIQGETVSKKHAEFRNSDGMWDLIDLDSRNGTFINGEQVHPGIAMPVESKNNVWFGGYRTLFLPPRGLFAILDKMRGKL